MSNERYNILVVDDDTAILDPLSEYLRIEGYHVSSFSSARVALEAFTRKNDFQVVISDVRMPGLNGIQLLQRLHETDGEIPVILMTAYIDAHIAVEALKKGAFDMLFKPFDFEQAIDSITRATRRYDLVQIEKNYKAQLEKTVECRTAELTQSLDKLRKSFGGAIQAMSLAIEARDPYTSGHQRRTADLARAIAGEMGLPRDIIDGIHMAGMIHDIGKLSVPAEILSKPGKVTAYEYALIKMHPETGYAIIKEIEFPWPIADIIHQHHERMDGSGYPTGLSGDRILVEARIMAVADVVEATASHRPYRPARGIDVALAEISDKSGILYASDAVDACLRVFQRGNFQLAHR